MLDVHSQMAAFCNKYNIAAKRDTIDRLVDEMTATVMQNLYPFTLRLTYSEQSDTTALDFMKEGATDSFLPSEEAVAEIKPLCQEIIEEPTTRGFRVKLII